MNNADTSNGSIPAGKDSAQVVPQTNFKRLIIHLRKDSLAVKLVSAYAAAEEGKAAQAIKDVMTGRLDELKSAYDAHEDQQN